MHLLFCSFAMLLKNLRARSSYFARHRLFPMCHSLLQLQSLSIRQAASFLLLSTVPYVQCSFSTRCFLPVVAQTFVASIVRHNFSFARQSSHSKAQRLALLHKLSFCCWYSF